MKSDSAWQMINLKKLIKFDDWLENSLSSYWKKLCSEMKDFTQKLWDSCLMKNESKISSSEEICHVTSDENESEIINDLSVNNDSNSNSSDDFVSAMSFTHFVLSIAVSDVTVYQDERQFKDFEKKC